MATSSGSVQCAGSSLGEHRHICAFFNDLDEQHRVLRSFIKEGFEQGDKAFHIVDLERWDDHLRRLGEAGIDVDGALDTGQLELRRWQDAYLRDDRFDQDGMLALIDEVLQSGSAAGYPLTRFVSNAEWTLVDAQAGAFVGPLSHGTLTVEATRAASFDAHSRLHLFVPRPAPVAAGRFAVADRGNQDLLPEGD